MKKIMISALALIIGAGPALADPPWQRGGDDDHGNGQWRQERQQDHREIRQDRQDMRQDDRNDGGPREMRDDRRDLRQDRRDWRDDGPRFQDNHPRYQYNGRDYDAWRGPRWSPPPGHSYRSWRRGERLPDIYWREPRYYVDYRVYHLAPPPRGYRYVRVDGDVYLVAIASGLIAAGIMGMFLNDY